MYVRPGLIVKVLPHVSDKASLASIPNRDSEGQSSIRGLDKSALWYVHALFLFSTLVIFPPGVTYFVLLGQCKC